MPEWLSEDPECAAVQGMMWATFILADTDNDFVVTLGEMEASVEWLMGVTPEDVAEVYNLIAGEDGDITSISETDGEAACHWLIDNDDAFDSMLDCLAVEVLMYIAD